MTLKRRFHLLIGSALALGFFVFGLLAYQNEKKEAEANLLASVEHIRNLLMSTRRVYHHQFIDSGLPLNDETLGFLPAHALGRISNDLANWDKTGFSFNNVSDQARNPQNQADAIEMAAIDYFRQYPQDELRFVPFTDSNGKAFYHYARPIWVETYCLSCHGERHKAPDAVRQRYNAAYNYQAGELRGILSIKIPAATLQEQLQHKFLFTLSWSGSTLVLLWLLIGFLVRRHILQPLSALRDGIGALTSGNYAGNLSNLPDEFGAIGRAFDRMATSLTEQRQHLAASEQRFRLLATTATDAIILADDEDRILFWNKGAEHCFGYTQAEMLERPIRNIIPERFREQYQSALHGIRADGDSSHHFGGIFELAALHRNGTEIPVEIALNSWLGEGKQYFVTILRDISERKRIEHALRESENRFHHIASLTNDLIYSCYRAEDRLFRFHWIGGNAERLFGYSIEELMARGCWRSFVVNEDQPLFATHVTNLLPGESSGTILRIRHRDGSLRYLCCHSQVEENGEHGCHRLFGALQDITERKNFEVSLQESENRFRSLANSAPVLIWVAEPDKRCSWFNHTWLEYTGRSLLQEYGNGWQAGIHPEDLDYCLDTYRARFDARMQFQMEYRLRGRDGEYRWFIDVGKPRYDEHGQFLGYIGMLTGIDERKQIEAAMHFRQFSLDHCGEEVFWIDQNGRILDANLAACQKLGFTHDEITQLTVAQVDADFPFAEWPHHWLELKRRKSLRFESKHRHKNGHVFPIEVVANYFEYGGKAYNCALVRDISERKAFEDALKEKTDFLNTILNSEPECVKVLDQDLQLLEMNQTGLKLLEVDHIGAARQYGLINFVLPEFRPAFKKLHGQVFQGKTGTLEFIIEGQRGSRYWMDMHAAPLFDENGKVKAMVAVTRDISDRISLLQELEYQAQIDFLTGLANRRHFLALAEQELSRSQRYDTWVSLLMMDIDFFKNINDSHGHKAGDQVLQTLAGVCKSMLREIDVIGRMGGEEFAILLPETTGERAVSVANRLRHELENTRVSIADQNTPIQFTVSIGVATLATPEATLESMLQEADKALYLAKNSGRNKVFAAFDPRE